MTKGIAAIGVLCKNPKDAKPLIEELRKSKFECVESTSILRDIEILVRGGEGEIKSLMPLLIQTGKVLEVTCLTSENMLIMNNKMTFSLADYLNSKL